MPAVPWSLRVRLLFRAGDAEADARPVDAKELRGGLDAGSQSRIVISSASGRMRISSVSSPSVVEMVLKPYPVRVARSSLPASMLWSQSMLSSQLLTGQNASLDRIPERLTQLRSADLDEWQRGP